MESNRTTVYIYTTNNYVKYIGNATWLTHRRVNKDNN